MDVNEELLICSLYTYKFIVCSFIVCSFSKQELIAFKWWVFYFKPWDTKHSLLPCRLLIRLTCSGGRKPVWKIQIRFENLEQRCKKNVTTLMGIDLKYIKVIWKSHIFNTLWNMGLQPCTAQTAIILLENLIWHLKFKSVSLACKIKIQDGSTILVFSSAKRGSTFYAIFTTFACQWMPDYVTANGIWSKVQL